ncbi:MAG: hypothetical protein J6S83_10145 [Lachnospiraceae bacterium]|nr:hypothetical protein [Lachnospiraceae bacterium]
MKKKITKGITKVIEDRKRAGDTKNGNTSGKLRENPAGDGADVPGSLSDEQIFDLAGGGRPGNPEPPH